MEQTLILIKPDGVQRGYVGEILSRFERKGLQIAGLKILSVSRAKAEEHYAVHKAKKFYPGLISFITASPVVAIVLRGVNAVAVSRKLMGATFGPDAEPGTIRGDLGISRGLNLIHGSDSPETAKEEIARFFKADELVAYDLAIKPWLYDADDVK